MFTIPLLSGHGSQPRRLSGTLAHTVGIAALIALLMASGAGVTFALWNSQAEAHSSATGAQLELTTTFADLDFSFTNDSLTTTGTYTVTNTTTTDSDTEATITSQLSASGDAQLASSLTVAVWPQTLAACTASGVPGGAITGTWSSVGAVTGSVASGDSITYCVRVTGVERGVMGTASGTLVITPTVSATLTIGNWSSATQTATATQTTASIYTATPPNTGVWVQLINQATNNCVDVYAANDDADTGLIDYPCKWGVSSAQYNQHWRFALSNTVNGANYYDLTPHHAIGLRMDVDGGSPNSLAEIEVQDDSAAQTSQEWQPQYRASGIFQLVNRQSGLCLTAYETGRYDGLTEYAQLPCDGSRDDQAFAARVPFAPPTMNLACADAGGVVTVTWAGSAPISVAFAVEPDPLGGGTSKDVGSVDYGVNEFSVAPTAFTGADGTFTLRATSEGHALASVPLWRITTGGVTTLSCDPPVPVIDSMNCVDSGMDQNRIVTCTIAPSASSAYTVQADTNTGAGFDWQNVGTFAAGSDAAVIDRFTVDSLAEGSYNLRVIDNAGNLLNSAWRLSIGSDWYWDWGWNSYKYPQLAGDGSSVANFTCTTTGQSNPDRRVRYSWEVAYPRPLTVQADNGTWTTIGTAPAGTTTLDVTGDPPLDWTKGTYDVRVLDGTTVVTDALTVRVRTNSGQKNLTCT